MRIARNVVVTIMIGASLLGLAPRSGAVVHAQGQGHTCSTRACPPASDCYLVGDDYGGVWVICPVEGIEVKVF